LYFIVSLVACKALFWFCFNCFAWFFSPRLLAPFIVGKMGTESPDVWPRTAEISFGNTEVTRHEFYECFEQSSNESDSIFDAISRLPGRAICVFRIGFKTVKDHIEFLDKFSAKESVVISGKEVRIRVRDRSVNLVRVRIQHFKFDDDLSLLNKRLREYGVISRIFWDTYQDRSLPRWNGIKTGVVNVDMEINKGIPSYITFGSYKDPLMVSYAGQMHTCRMCDSPTHVLANCPKQPRNLTNPSTISKEPIGTRSYSSALTNRAPFRTTIRKLQETGPIGGGQMPIAPTFDAISFPELAQRSAMSAAVVPDGAPEEPISKPDEAESFSDTNTDAEDASCVDPSVASKSVKKKKIKETREFRDQQKQSEKRSRTAFSNSSGEEAVRIGNDVAQLVELEATTREVPVSIPGVVINSSPILSEGDDDVPTDTFALGVQSFSSTMAQMDNEAVEEMETTELVSGSNPEGDISFSDGSIQPGQRPLDSQATSHLSETQESLGGPLGTPSTPIVERTLKAMEAFRRKKPQGNKPQPSKPKFRN
jgi:hypothetical protein